MDKRLSTLVVIALMTLVLLAAFYLGAQPPQGGQSGDPVPMSPVVQGADPLREGNTLVVWGKGKGAVAPEGARFYLRYQAEGRTAEKALESLNQAVAKGIAELAGDEYDRDMLRTVRQEVELNKNGRFTAVSVLEVVMDDFAQAASFVDRAVATGASLDGPIQPRRGDVAAARQEALRQAMEDAKVSAQGVAANLNKQIGEPLVIEEGTPQEGEEPMTYLVTVKVAYKLR